MDADEKGSLAAIKKNPKDATARGAYADWLDEHGRAHDAMLQRAAAVRPRRKNAGARERVTGCWRTCSAAAAGPARRPAAATVPACPWS